MAAREHFGLDETMAFGDGGNDIPIIRQAGIGVAMGNATDNVNDGLQGINTGLYVIVHVGICLCFDGCRSFVFATGIYNSKHGVCSSKVKAYYIRLLNVIHFMKKLRVNITFRLQR